MGRTIVIGDVHGCADELGDLLAKLRVNSQDRLIQVGDLVNRGPDSARCVQIAQENGFELVLGNHELRLLNGVKTGDHSLLKSYDCATLAKLDDTDWAYLEQAARYLYLPVYNAVVVHGGFLPDRPWREQTLRMMTRIQVVTAGGLAAKRSEAPNAPAWASEWAKSWREGDRSRPFVVYGHTPRPEIFFRTGSIGIDTGCVYGGYLTAYIVEEARCVQVPARNVYALSKRFAHLAQQRNQARLPDEGSGLL